LLAEPDAVARAVALLIAHRNAHRVDLHSVTDDLVEYVVVDQDLSFPP
jgi:hypothetical protein